MKVPAAPFQKERLSFCLFCHAVYWSQMLKRLEIAGFKSFARKTVLDFSNQTTAIVGPNGSGKSNVAEAFRFALGEQSMKSMRGKRSEDLIFSGTHMSARANRAAVAIVFDNARRIFPKIDFDEVAIERAVFRDGSSEYSLNGSKVRLRDIQELLASANIGETGHHIISQGEADRILLANPRERRAMLEDALGLKAFEFRKQEAVRKLEKTDANVKEVEALRREIAPHIRFLKKQVERLERAEELSRELATACQQYFAIEELYLDTEKSRVIGERAIAGEKLSTAEAELKAFEDRTAHDSEGMKHVEKVRQAERTLDAATQERAQLAREMGRVEGALDSAKRRSHAVTEEPYVKVPRQDLSQLQSSIERAGDLAGGIENADQAALRAALDSIRGAIGAFLLRFTAPKDEYLADEENAVYALEGERVALAQKDEALANRIADARAALERARQDRTAYDETGREQQHRLLSVADARATQEANVARLDARLNELNYLSEEFERERHEVLALAGSAALSYEKLTALPAEDRRAQEERKRGMERLKIRVEEAGGGTEDVKKEYEEAITREEFLARELDDLAKSAEGLRALITDLDTELHKTFSEGLVKVNASFSEFFSLMFNGGGAKLVLEEIATITEEDDEDETEGSEEQAEGKAKKQGIEISVNLPKKRVQSLMQLSGGERALTSIALIFAMSQVNPPPFLILDETDAALDEANSRRYGDMIDNLAKKSQLIVISHNRETMSRAGILYGVTMGADGISKLLSVRFEDAVQVAK
ncbi:MAG: Smc, chromosome segregation ATPase, chromosome segregation protein [Parcubacteria group bacterium]|nr:Smc, chromosome segregation ATPase, chromosome segregation protein [Parcubacteria group bacterium]